ASFDTGSELLINSELKKHKEIIGIKPLSNLKKIKEILKSDCKKNIKIVILGAGAAGVEFALALKNSEKHLEKSFQLELLDRGVTILPTFDRWIQENIEKEIIKNEIDFSLGYEILSIENKKIIAKNKDDLIKKIEFDYIIWAGGPSANRMYKESGFFTDEKGYMLVNSKLQSLDYPYIFGAGDCVALKDYNYVKKVGVYAIREAEYLWENILNYLNDKPLKTFIPQKKYLLIISLGGKKAILNYYGIKLKGKLAWKIKDIIDSNFMNKFKN
ncbi:MAG: NAD(P)/FAD-dependent oxidoreductase, partial [Fusobacteriaceae bacterium]